MSHVATVDVTIKDLACLKKACEKLGLEFMEGQTTYKWFGRWVDDYDKQDAAYRHGIDPKDYGKCVHAIRVKGQPDAYEVGVARKPDGSLTLIWDFFAGGRGLMDVIGDKASKLRQLYALEVGAKTLRKQGFTVDWKRNKTTGKPQLKARRG